MSKLSIIVPVFNEEETVAIFYNAIELERKNFAEYDIEYWYIDDGSTDGTVAAVEALIARDENVHLVSFSRNFGKEAGLYAGLEHATGDYVAVMDVDLQDPPSYCQTCWRASHPVNGMPLAHAAQRVPVNQRFGLGFQACFTRLLTWCQTPISLKGHAISA